MGVQGVSSATKKQVWANLAIAYLGAVTFDMTFVFVMIPVAVHRMACLVY